MDEKRTYTRRAVSAEGGLADALGEHWTPIKVVDISPGGVGFLCSHQLAPGSVRLVRMIVASQPESVFRAPVRIAHCVPHSLFKGYRIGAQFLSLDMAQIVQIERLAAGNAPV